MKMLIVTAAMILAITTMNPALATDEASPRITTGYLAFKKPYDLKQCVQHAYDLLNSFKGIQVEKGYYTVWGNDEHITVSITCAYEASAVFFSYAGSRDLANDTFKNIMSSVQEQFEPDRSKLKRNPLGRSGQP